MNHYLQQTSKENHLPLKHDKVRQSDAWQNFGFQKIGLMETLAI